MAGGKEEYNAFFYSLVSTDTQVGVPFSKISFAMILISITFEHHLKCFLFMLSLLQFQEHWKMAMSYSNAGDVLFYKKATIFDRPGL